ncbi:hypothetical protein HY346_00945 [Candidatus Microgenomates bacterium]|nr:hypothetical protein [Candidatus Microgenomates bacterium]
MKIHKNQRGIAHLAVFIVIALAAIGFVGYVSWNAYSESREPSNDEITQNRRIYTCDGFDFTYTTSWRITKEKATDTVLCSFYYGDELAFSATVSKNVAQSLVDYADEAYAPNPNAEVEAQVLESRTYQFDHVKGIKVIYKLEAKNESYYFKTGDSLIVIDVAIDKTSGNQYAAALDVINSLRKAP